MAVPQKFLLLRAISPPTFLCLLRVPPSSSVPSSSPRSEVPRRHLGVPLPESTPAKSHRCRHRGQPLRCAAPPTKTYSYSHRGAPPSSSVPGSRIPEERRLRAPRRHRGAPRVTTPRRAVATEEGPHTEVPPFWSYYQYLITSVL